MPNTNKKWTVMVYLAGDNNLDQNGVEDLNEMKKTGSTQNINVIAQFDRAGAGAATNRYYLKKGTSLNADVTRSLGETNTGDPAGLIDFFNWGAANYPADHYLFVLWNHGQGWDDTDVYAGERGSGYRIPRSNRIRHSFFETSVKKAAKLSVGNIKTTRAILLDDNAKDFLDNLEMKKVMDAAKKTIGRKLDIVGMDACLMSMAEVGYQMRDSVLYTVGSEETEPLEGWPYDTILSAMNNQPDISPFALSKLIVQHYITSYKGSGEAVTQSACDLSCSTAFAAAVRKLGSALKTGLSNPAARASIVDIRNRVQDYEVQDNVDLTDLCKRLKTSSVSAIIKGACDSVLAAIKGNPGLVIASGYMGASMKRSNGVAIYFPTRSVSPLYAGLDFSKKTGWDKFLKTYITVTRS
ncbi:peptidase C11 [Candidatus Desantisbacteria bacterium]|nr:peptidase C11 [Candidatus Desantisbacteria bacterium]